MTCNKTAYADLGVIRRRLTRKKDHKPRKDGCIGHYFCTECQAYHLIYRAVGRKKAVS